MRAGDQTILNWPWRRWFPSLGDQCGTLTWTQMTRSGTGSAQECLTPGRAKDKQNKWKPKLKKTHQHCCFHFLEFRSRLFCRVSAAFINPRLCLSVFCSPPQSADWISWHVPALWGGRSRGSRGPLWFKVLRTPVDVQSHQWSRSFFPGGSFCRPDHPAPRSPAMTAGISRPQWTFHIFSSAWAGVRGHLRTSLFVWIFPPVAPGGPR